MSLRQLVASVMLLTNITLAGEVLVSEPIPLERGAMTVLTRAHSRSNHLMIHFHGGIDQVKAAFERTDQDLVLIFVNFPGLSSAYSKPFESKPELFQLIQNKALEMSSAEHWQRVYVSSFSAGYAAVREILKTPASFQQIDGIVAADSIYAGLQKGEPIREVDQSHMQDFLRFAELAAKNEKRFMLSHSAQVTPYASTTETADYLLHNLKIERKTDHSIQSKTMQLQSSAEAGGFSVLGYAGTTGPEHMQHLHNIDQLWSRLYFPK